jgi:hypothetical protein
MTMSNPVPADTRVRKKMPMMRAYFLGTDTFASWPQFQKSLALLYCRLKAI